MNQNGYNKKSRETHKTLEFLMHLRSGKSIALGLSKPLRVSTQESGTGPSTQLSPIVEDTYLGETESTTSTSISMASYNEGMSEDMDKVRFEVPLFNTRLIYLLNNKRGHTCT